MMSDVELFETLTGLSTSINSTLHHMENKNAKHLLDKFKDQGENYEIIQMLTDRKYVGSVATLVGEMLIPIQDEVMSQFLRRFGIWEPKESWIISKIINEQRVLNFGCALGWYLKIAQCGGASEIVGIDANPIACEVARFNSFIHPGVQPQIFNYAISKDFKEFELIFDTRNFGNTVVVPKACGKVMGKSASYFFERYRPNVIISDIQGNDWQILEAFYEYSKEDKILMLENDPTSESTQSVVLRNNYSNYELLNGHLDKMASDQMPSPNQSTIFVTSGHFTAKIDELLASCKGEIPTFGNFPDLISEYFHSGLSTNQD